MRPSSIKYFLKEGFTGLFRNRLMTIASIATVAACIFIVTASVCIVQNLTSVLDQIEDNVGVAVFLEDDLSSEEISNLRDDMMAIDHVTMVTYISPEEALDSIKDEWDAAEILEGFEGENNPLSHSFEIALENIEYQNEVLETLNSMKGVRNIRHAQTETDIILKINNILSIVGVVIVAILAMVSIVLIVNTIKISVYTRKTEINIMKYVGATDWFIRWPFVIEGIMIGLIGSVIPIAVSWPVYDKIVEVIYSYIPVISNIATLLSGAEIFSKMIPFLLGAGIFLGVAGSVTSIRKYLKV